VQIPSYPLEQEKTKREAITMPYVATINVPGYLPMDDDPPVFDTAQEAWEYLASERERGEDDTEGENYSATVEELQTLADPANWRNGVIDSSANDDGTGTIYANTPGYDGGHDLGLAYSVTFITEEEQYPEGTTTRLDCGCLGHKTRMGEVWGFYCEAEQQGYCNFEHTCGMEEE
jgi:hypothetical protein